MVRETRNKRYYESPPPDSDRPDSDHPPKRQEKETNPIKKHYSQSPEQGSPRAETSTASETPIAMVQKLSEGVIDKAFSRPATPEMYIDSDNKLLESFIRDEYREAIEKFTNQSREHLSEFKVEEDFVKENDERIETLLVSIETLIQEAKKKSADPAKKHASKSLDVYMTEGYIDGIRTLVEGDHEKLKLYLKDASTKKEAKDAHNRVKELLEEPMPKTLDDLENFIASLKEQTDIKTQHLDKRKEVYKMHAEDQALFIGELEDVQNHLVPAKSPSPSSTESFNFGEIDKMIDIAETRRRGPLLYGGTESFGPGEMTGTVRQTSPEITEAPSSPTPEAPGSKKVFG